MQVRAGVCAERAAVVLFPVFVPRVHPFSQVTVGGVVASGADIHRPTAEQQAARAALQALGLPLEELSLVEADRLTMLDIARSLPGLPNRPGVAERPGQATYAASVAGDGGAHNGNCSNGAGKAARKTAARRV